MPTKLERQIDDCSINYFSVCLPIIITTIVIRGLLVFALALILWAHHQIKITEG